MLLLDAFRPLEAVVAASYLTSGGGAEAVVGVLLYLMLLLDAFTATEGCRGGGAQAVVGVLLYLMLLLDAFRPLEAVVAASYSISCCYWMPSQRPKAVVAAAHMPSWRRPTLSPAAT